MFFKEKNKPRLYFAVGKETGPTGGQSNPFRWMFLIGPKNEDKDTHSTTPGTRFTLGLNGAVEETHVYDLKRDEPFLARFMISKIRDMEQVKRAIFGAASNKRNFDWTSQDWFQAVLGRLEPLCGRTMALSCNTKLDWDYIYVVVIDYLRMKARTHVLKMVNNEEYEVEDAWPDKPRPTWNLLECGEIYNGE
ncbi:unnamed protein product [Clonostachys rosea]|uniref:Uncharacterized protein n=1 Tax=Bionectria ochroleuca TaxID=29856 RepID=A0ABY6UIA0_BIOOC|nr:unnamed protein product [Clonostachys rosea]